MGNEKIEVKPYLGIKIQKRLREKFGIETDGKYFSEDELSKVDELEIVPPLEGGLEGIELLSNLEKLTIESVGNTAFQTQEIHSIADGDIGSVAKCGKLKELTIVNQSKISCLDCSQLPELTNVTIKNNRALRIIKGLENITTLLELNCYGNESLQQVENLDQVILNNPDLCATKLDFLLYQDAIGYNPQNGEYNLKAHEKLGRINEAVFVESMLKKEVNINASKMTNLHNKAMDILAENNIDGTNLESAEKVEKYIAQNVQYNGQKENKIIPENKEIMGARSTANGAYNAIMEGKCNCEGFTRLMQYFLKLKGIKSRNVYCVPQKENSDFGENYHSVVALEDSDLYGDPCSDAVTLTSPSLKTREEIQKNYRFDEIHLKLEIPNSFFKEKGATTHGVEEIGKEANKDLSLLNLKQTKEEERIHE